jgi:hypothetical protein
VFLRERAEIQALLLDNTTGASFFVPWFVYEFIDDPHAPDRVSNAPDEPLALLNGRSRRPAAVPIGVF